MLRQQGKEAASRACSYDRNHGPILKWAWFALLDHRGYTPLWQIRSVALAKKSIENPFRNSSPCQG
jgi:hypothetical protein